MKLMQTVKAKTQTPFMTLYYLKRTLLRVTVLVFSFSQVNVIYGDEVAPIVEAAPVTETQVAEVLPEVSPEATPETTEETKDATEGDTAEVTETTEKTAETGSESSADEPVSEEVDTTETEEMPVLTPDVLSGSTPGAGDVQVATTGEMTVITEIKPHVKTIISEASKLRVEDTKIDAIFKKDEQDFLREIQVQQESTIPSTIGVTIVIPNNTKIFSPTIDTGLQHVVIPPIQQIIPVDTAPTILPVAAQPAADASASEEVDTTETEEIEETEVSSEESTAVEPAEVIEPAPATETVTGISAEAGPVVSEIIVANLEASISDPYAPIDPLEGQAPLNAEYLLIESVEKTEIQDHEVLKLKEQKIFSFGMEGQHLVFTKPIEMRVAFPELSDGVQVMLKVQHHGDESFSTKGLSNDAQSTCDEEGNNSRENAYTTIRNGEAVFYTCGASTFAVGEADTGFNPNANGVVLTIDKQADGKILMGGFFGSIGGNTRGYFGRVTSTGLFDATFTPSVDFFGYHILAQPDGNVILGGSFSNVGGISRARMGRVTTTGLVDTTFNAINMNATPDVISLQADGSFLVGGTFTTIGGGSRNYLARITSTGLLVSAFDANLNNTVYDIIEEGNGWILIAGGFSTVNATTRNGLARISTTGLLDSSFNPNVSVGFGASAKAIGKQSDGSIIVGGDFTSAGGVTRNRIARYSSTGLLDTTFNPNLNGTVYKIAIQPNDYIIAAGSFTTVGGVHATGVMRLTNTGLHDTSFNPRVHIAGNGIQGLELEETSVLIGGNFTNVSGSTYNRIARIGLGETSNSTAPTSVSLSSTSLMEKLSAGKVAGVFTTADADSSSFTYTFDTSCAGTLDNDKFTIDGNFLVINHSFNYDTQTSANICVRSTDDTALFVTGAHTINIVRLTSGITGGTADPIYIPSPDAQVNSISVFPDGKSFVHGYFSSIGGANRYPIAVLTHTGRNDPTFTIPTSDDEFYTSFGLPDGKILVGGPFYDIGGRSRPSMARLTATGLVDHTFETEANGQPSAVVAESNGDYIIAGYFTSIWGNTRRSIARVTSTGGIVTEFNANINSTGNVLYIAKVGSGKYIIAGNFVSVGGTARRNIARITSTGLLDTTFVPNVTTSITTIDVQSDSSVIYANGAGAFGRLTNTGLADAGFAPTLNGNVNKVAVQSNDYVLIGGNFTTVDGQTRNRLARLTSTGLLDTAFPDPDFGPVGAGTTIWGLTIENDESVLVGGTFTSVAGDSSKTYLTRIGLSVGSTEEEEPPVIPPYSTGLLDATFNPNADSTVFTVGIQSDRKVLAGGEFGSIGGVTNFGFARVTTTGRYDPTFAPAGVDETTAVLVQPDQKILMGGRSRFIRYTSTGLTDPTFSGNASGGPVWDIVIQPDGNMLIAGGFTTVWGTARSRVARVTSTGRLDTTFTANTATTVNTIALESDGDVIIGGLFTSGGGATRNRIMRTTSTGLLDTTFNPNAGGEVNRVAIDSNGKILVGGSFTTIGGATRNNLALLTSTGLADDTFNPNVNGRVRDIKVQLDGKIVIGGEFTAVGGVTRNRLARLTSTGLLDTTFNPNANGAVYTIGLDTDGGMVIGGLFTTVGGVTRNYIARLSGGPSAVAPTSISLSGDSIEEESATGTLVGTLSTTDTDSSSFTYTFDTSCAGTLDNSKFTISGDQVLVNHYFDYSTQSSANICIRSTDTTALYVTGAFTISITEMVVIPPYSNGVLDTNFDPNVNGSVRSIVLQDDGNIVLGGVFTGVGGTTRNNIARVTSTGLLDSSFNANVNLGVYSIGLNTNGSITFGGVFWQVGGVSRNRVARVTSTGQLDANFDVNVNSWVNSLVVQPDGKTVIGGLFTEVGGQTFVNRLIRVSSTGLRETPFMTAGSSVWTVALQTDGKILAGGDFTSVATVGGNTRNRAARATATGLVDATFGDPNINSTVYAITQQADGHILVGGDFTSVGGDTNQDYFSRLTSTGQLDTSFNVSVNNTVRSIVVQQDGKILIGGDFTNVGGVTRNRIARVTSTGLLDADFNPNANGTVYAIALDTDGSILVGGDFTTIGGVTRNRFARLASSATYAPTLISLSGTAISEESATGTLVGTLSTTDEDSSSFTYTFDTSCAGTLDNDKFTISGDQILVNHYFDYLSQTGANICIKSTDDTALFVTGAFTIDITELSNGSYGTGLIDPNANSNPDSWVEEITVQADGKVLIGGQFETVGGQVRNYFARVLSTGVLDTAFDVFLNSKPQAIAVQPDGKILLGGGFTTVESTSRNFLARVTETGLVDTTFNANIAGPVGSITDIIVQSDGKILVGGFWLSTIAGGTRTGLARLTSTGLLDTTFNANLDGYISNMKTQPDGKILIQGMFTTVGGASVNGMARITNTGLRDATFAAPIGAENSLAFALQPDGKIVIVGVFDTIGGVSRNGIARLSSTGLVEAGYDPNSNDLNVLSVAIQSDGKAVIGGQFSSIGGIARNAIVRLTSTGLVDPTFTSPLDTFSSVNAIAIDGYDTYIGGQFFTLGGAVANFAKLPGIMEEETEEPTGMYATGIVHPDFNPNVTGGGVGATVNDIYVEDDRSFLIAGYFTSINGITKGPRGHISSTGLALSTFSGFQNNPNSFTRSIIRLQDNRIMAGGWFTAISAVARYGLTIQTATGGVDSSVNPSGNLGSNVEKVYKLADGNIIVGGNFESLYGTTKNSLARITSGGTLDTAFTASANGRVRTIAEQADGKIVVGGDFSQVNSTSRNYLGRVTATGLLDSTFNPNPNNDVYDIDIQSDGGIVLVGEFTSVSSTARNRIARVTATGLLDSTFNPNLNGSGLAVTIQPDGKILIGGYFTTVGGVARERLARLNADGTLDTTFSADADAKVHTIVMDGYDIMVGGEFSTIAGVSRNRFARLVGQSPAEAPTDISLSTGSIVEKSATGTVVGNFITTDGNFGDTFTYTFDTSCAGTLDNSKFTISGNQLLVNHYFLYTAQTNAAICVKSTDSASYYITGLMNITIVEQYPAPAGRALGEVEPTVNPNANNIVYGAVTQQDYSVVFAGQFTSFGGATRNRLARLTSTGLLDATFNPNVNSTINNVKLQADGSILIGGIFTTVGGTSRNRLARVTTTGLLDSTFNPNVNNSVMTIQPLSNGDIFIGGTFTGVGGVTRNRVALLTSTGLLDTTFNPNVNNAVNAAAVDANGNILIGGTFSTVGGVTRNRIARLTSTGLLDTTFNPNMNSTVQKILVEPDGKILIGGQFSTVGGVSRVRLARVSSTGLLDANFNPNVNNTIWTMERQSNGNILIGGAFTAVGGVTRNRIARLSSTGLLDMTFDPNANNIVEYIEMHGPDALYVVGRFTSMGGVSRNRVARIGLLPSHCVALHGCGIWLKADAGIVLAATGVYHWGNQGLHLVTGVQISSTLMPIVVTGSMNYNPVVRFDGTNDIIGINNNFSEYDTTQFTVFRTSNSDGMITSVSTSVSETVNAACDQMVKISGGNVQTTLSGETLTSSLVSNNNTAQLVTMRFGSGYNHSLSMHGQLQANGTKKWAGLTIDAGMRIGRGTCSDVATGGVFGGDIAEILRFRRILQEDEIQVVESYLSLKYGMTLDQSTPTDYILSGGVTAWDASAVGAYSGNIAGIGRNDATTLQQPKSQSSNDTNDIIVEFTGTLVNNTFLVRGSDGNTTDTWTLTDTPANHRRIEREWRFEENNGDVGNVVVRIASGAIDGVVPGSMSMFIDEDNTFAAGATIVTGTYADGYREYVTNLDDGAFITFGEQTAPNVAPTNISIYPNAIQEGRESGLLVGHLTSADANTGDTFTYAFDVSCAGSFDNSSFELTGERLYTTASISYAAASVINLCIKVTDWAGAVYTGLVAIDVVPSQAGPIGTVHHVFNPNNAVHYPMTMARQPDGSIIFGGQFSAMGGSTRNNIARVTYTGLLDATFNPNASAIVNTIKVLDDGNILIGGNFAALSGTSPGYIVRITSTGIRDNSFNASADGNIEDIEVQPDGKIIVGGNHFAFGGVATHPKLTRLTNTGRIDTSFSSQSTINGQVSAVALQSDGQVVFGGLFSFVQGVARNGIARVSSTGLLDSTFNPNANSSVTEVEIQPDGKILIAGSFTTVGGVTRNRLARLTTTGLVDDTFDAGVLGSNIFDIELQDDGSIFIAGSFTGIGGAKVHNVARLSSTGLYDSTFDVFLNTNQSVISMLVDGESIILGGSFSSIGGQARNGIARVGLLPSHCASVGGCGVRLKADAGITSSATGVVSGWVSQGLHVLTGLQNTVNARPLVVTGVINNNPVVRFDGSDDGMYMVNSFSENVLSKFVVFRTTDTSAAITALANSTNFTTAVCDRTIGINAGSVTARLSGELITGGAANTNAPQLVSWDFGTGNGQDIYVQSKVRDSGVLEQAIMSNDSLMLLGNGACGGGAFNGDIAEIISYNRMLTVAEKNTVDSYLAIKYGITLDQTSPTNYTLSGAGVVWSASAAGSYYHDIAGIGRNDISTLHQSRSQSANSTNDITIEFTGALSDDTFLMRSNDAGSITGWTDTDIPDGYERLSRERRFEENNGDVGNVVISIATGALPEPVDTLVMFIDADSTFATASVPHTGTYNTTTQSWEFAANIPDNYYITFASIAEAEPEPIVWLRADAGVSLSGSKVFNLNDYNGNYIAQQTSSAAQPLLVNNGLNFNPVVRFSGSQSLSISSLALSPYNNIDIYLVHKVNTGSLTLIYEHTTNINSSLGGFYYSANDNSCGSQCHGGFIAANRGNVGYSIYSSLTGTDAPIVSHAIFDKSAVSGETNILFNGRQIPGNMGSSYNVNNTNNYDDAPFYIGGRGGNQYTYQGDIAELIIIDGNMSDDFSYLDTYLALKYGITLDQTTTTNYILPEVGTVRSAASAGSYDHDIAGIGRNDASTLNQKKSQSVNNANDIIVEFTGTFANDKVLTRGNDAGIATGRTTTDVATGYTRLGRERRFEENNGDVGNIIVRYASGALPHIVSGDLIMFVDADGVMNDASVPHTGTYNASSNMWEFTVNVTDGEYITFAYLLPEEVEDPGVLDFGSPTSLSYTGIILPRLTSQVIDNYFADSTTKYFRVDDYKGLDAGYTTTLQMSGNLTTGDLVIASGNVSFKVNSSSPDLISGSANSNVLVNGSAGYAPLHVANTLIYRSPGANSSLKGTYGTYIRLQVTIPANQPWGAYAGTMVYTLIEN